MRGVVTWLKQEDYELYFVKFEERIQILVFVELLVSQDLIQYDQYII